MRRNFLILLWMLILHQAFAQQGTGVKIHPYILALAERGERIPCFLLLDEQAVDVHVDPGLSKEEKTSRIYTALSSLADHTQRPLSDSLQAWNIPHRKFYIVNAIRADLDSTTLHKIKDWQGLQSILPDFPLAAPSEALEPGDIRRMDTLLHWGISHIGADQVWKMGITGKGAVVAGLDTGLEWDHDFLKKSYRGWQNGEVDHDYNWHDGIRNRIIPPGNSARDSLPNPCGLSTDTPCDDHGHGSFTMGLMTGYHDAQRIGIAPGARWIGARVMDQGIGLLSTYLSGLEWCLAPTDGHDQYPQPALAPDIINNSWGCPEGEGCIPENYWMLDTAASRLTQAGILVVSSAGNDGRDGCQSLTNPLAIFRSVLTVGATSEQDSITAFSSRGPVGSTESIKPDVVAPGQGITSIYPNGRFQKSNGTSISAPMVAGIGALILEANPRLRGRPDLIREIITRSAVPILENPCTPAQHPNPVYGYGRADALAAVELAREYLPTSVSHSLPNEKLRIYPNPARDILHLDSQIDQPGHISLYHAQGRLVKTLPISGWQTIDLHVADLAPGFYIVHFSTPQGQLQKKMIKI